MTSHTFVVYTKPIAGEEDAFNRWYDTQHIPDVVAVPGVRGARRFVAEVDGVQQFLALYDIETDDPDAVLAEIQARAGTERMPMSPALDSDSISAVLYRALGPAVTK